MADSCLSRVLASGRSYLDLCQQVQPGDVLAFSGCDVPSSVVKIAAQSCYVCPIR